MVPRNSKLAVVNKYRCEDWRLPINLAVYFSLTTLKRTNEKLASFIFVYSLAISKECLKCVRMMFVNGA